jgi:hypothetical protein
MDSNELLSDLIKIGIPSLVALTGTLSSILLAWWSHKQSLLIEELKHTHEANKERNIRTGELVRSCAIEINNLHTDLTAFAVILHAKIDTIVCGDPWPEAEQELIAERFQTALTTAHRHNSVRSQIMLLGNNELSYLYQEYLETVGQIFNTYAEEEIMQAENFESLMDRSRSLQSATMNKMSNIYLLSDSQSQS